MEVSEVLREALAVHASGNDIRSCSHHPSIRRKRRNSTKYPFPLSLPLFWIGSNFDQLIKRSGGCQFCKYRFVKTKLQHHNFTIKSCKNGAISE
jgi:hypothetical protein